MTKLRFNNYIYYKNDGLDTDITVTPQNQNTQFNGKPLSDYAYNSNKFDEYINNYQYSDAYEYGKHYILNDSKENKANLDDLEYIRQQGSIIESIYSKVSPEDKAAIQFYNAVGNDGGLENFSKIKGDSTYNEYADRFVQLKNELGGEGSTKLKIHFDNKKQTLFGIDRLAKDNPYGVEDFYNSIGISEQDFRNIQGISVVKKDDDGTTIEFDKSHPLANKIIAHIPHRGTSGKVWDTIKYPSQLLGQLFSSIRYDSVNPLNLLTGPARSLEDAMIARTDWQGNYIGSGQEYGISITGLDANGKEVSSSHNGDWTLRQIKSLLNDARDVRNKYNKTLNLDNRAYSSTVGPSINIQLDNLKRMSLSDDEFAKMYKRDCDEWDSFIRTFGSQDFELYTNANNKETSDNVLDEIKDGKEKELLSQKLTAVKPSQLTFRSMISGDKSGILVEVDYDPEHGLEDFNKERKVQVFIPDNGRASIFNHVTESIKADPQIRAVDEVNKMKDYQYAYQTYNNDGKLSILTYDKDNGYIFEYTDKNGRKTQMNSDDATRFIMKDNFVKELSTNIVHRYLTHDSSMVTTPNDFLGGFKAYDAFIQQAAYMAVNNLYPNVDLRFADGTEIPYQDIFSIILSKNNDAIESLLGNYYQNQQDKIDDMLDIYNKLLETLNTYNIKFPNS